MQAVVDWIKSIAYYVIVISVFHGILPDNRYKKYVQLFTGLVLVLLILSPVVRLAGQEETMASLFIGYAEEILEGDFAEGEENPQTMLFIETEIRQMLGECGYEVTQCRLSLNTQGQVSGINLTLREQNGNSIQTVAPIVQPEISLGHTGDSSTANQEDMQVISALTEMLAGQYGINGDRIDMKIQ